ncbi:hypothetical protein K438DRAFT_1993276 [Mycena galopus ATCC 62051]|nr:hypothetical protein K438DRAFT_1993276 [Mycena galopus ATCC 62051]
MPVRKGASLAAASPPPAAAASYVAVVTPSLPRTSSLSLGTSHVLLCRRSRCTRADTEKWEYSKKKAVRTPIRRRTGRVVGLPSVDGGFGVLPDGGRQRRPGRKAERAEGPATAHRYEERRTQMWKNG